jgi:hypothetical protein
MSQIGEAVAKSGLGSVGKCPFSLPPEEEDPEPENEDYAWDDRLSMATAQANSAGKLGSNCESASPGASGSWNVLGADPPRYQAPQVDTARNDGGEVKVRAKEFPYTVAAHHLIPGNASLFSSRFFKSYMKKDGRMEVETPDGDMTFQVSHNIGYNVNGSHNGVWLPGSYAIVKGGDHPDGSSWKALNSPDGDIAWCHSYMAAVAKKAGGQFHDSHTNYNTNAKKILDEYAVKLGAHQVKCKPCREAAGKKLPPPYTAKAKLYKLSQYFRTQTTRAPSGWKLAWMTSDQVRTDIFSNPTKKRAFMKAYRAAR